MQRKRAMGVSRWCAQAGFILVLASLLVSVFASDASARRRGRPASLTDSVIFQATHLVTIGGYEPTTENIATASKLILKDLADTQKAKAMAGNIPTREFKQQQEKIYRAITQVDNRVQQLQRRGRRDPVKQFFRVMTAPVWPVVRAIGHVSKQVEKLFPPVLRPIVQVVLAQYVGKKYDSLVKKLISKFASPDAVKAYNMWKKLVPYKDNPALAAKELQARLKELAQGRIGEFLGKLTERALAKLPPDSPLREVITTKMEMWRASLIKNAQKEIDVMFEKNKEKLKKRVEKTAEGLLQPIPSSQLKKKVDKEGKDFREWVVETTTGVAPKKEGEEKATKVKATFDAKPDRGPVPLNVEFNAGRSEGEIKAYVWEFGDKKMGVGKIAGQSYQTPGEYEVTLTVVAEDGTKDTAKWSITVEAKREIELKAKVAAAPKEVQPGGKVAIEAEISTGGLKEGDVNVTIDVNGQVVLKKTEAVSEYDINVMAYYDVPENLENVTRTPRRARRVCGFKDSGDRRYRCKLIAHSKKNAGQDLQDRQDRHHRGTPLRQGYAGAGRGHRGS